jgi:penicillin-insensitive murein endopeptidase
MVTRAQTIAVALICVACIAAGCRIAPGSTSAKAVPVHAESERVPVQATAVSAVVPPPPPPPIVPEPETPPDDPLAPRFGAGPDDRTRSVGTAQNGHLLGGERLIDSDSLRVLPWTRQRGFDRGTGDLVRLIERSAAGLASQFPGSVVHVGNLSRLGGGDIPPSVSHNSGRDADVPFLCFERLGGSREAGAFVEFDGAGIAIAPAAAAGRFEFDTARNWALVRQWLSDPQVVVQWIFVSVPLRQLLLDHALRTGEPESLRSRAARVLVQPRDSSPHADHFHLRVACPPHHKPACIDGGVATAEARAAQVDALLAMYANGSPAEQRYARELLTLPAGGDVADLPPIEGPESLPTDGTAVAP